MKKVLFTICSLVLLHTPLIAATTTNEMPDTYQILAKELVINGTLQTIDLILTTESETIYYHQVTEQQIEMYLRQIKNYEPILLRHLPIEEHTDIDFYLLILIWNLELALLNRQTIDKLQLFYLIEDEQINMLYQQILTELLSQEDETLPQLETANALSNYDETINSRVDGPYQLTEVPNMQHITYQFLGDTYELIGAEQFYLTTTNYQGYVADITFYQQSYELQYFDLAPSFADYFTLTLGAPITLCQSELAFKEMFGALQFQFLTPEQKPLTSTTYQLLDQMGQVILAGTVNEAATKLIEQLNPGLYHLLYYINDPLYPTELVEMDIMIEPFQTVKKVQIIEKILGQITLHLITPNKTSIELYRFIDEKKQFISQFDLAGEEVVTIENLEVGEYYVKFNMVSFAVTSDDIQFTINESIQNLEYEVLETTHQLLAATGERTIERICISLSILFLSLWSIIMIRKKNLS